MFLSANEIGLYAKQAGFPDASIPTAVAIALAESSGNPSAHNAVPPDDSYGLWQINMLGPLLQERLKAFGISSASALLDPMINAKAAFIVSNGGKNFNPWTTFTSGAYQKYLPSNLPVIGPIIQAVPGLAALPYSQYLVPGLAGFLFYLLLSGGKRTND